MLRSRAQVGAVMVLASASAFGTIPILAKFAYAEGLSPLQVLTYRFLIATVGLTAIAVATGQGPRTIGWARALPLLGVGLFFYAGMAGTFFGALTVLPASLAELIAYIYPALVAIGGWTFFGGEMNRRVALALVISFAGLALLVGTIELRVSLALLLAFASPVLYAGYILASERLTRGVPAVLSSALVHTGAAITLLVVLLVVGPHALPHTVPAWAIVVAIALLPSMLGISLLLAGIARVGATRAAILSTLEPVVTIALAIALLGDRLNAFQALGAVLVLAAVLLTQWRRRQVIPPFEP